MKREYWLGLAAAGVLMMMPLSWLTLILLLTIPGLCAFLLLKEKFSLVESTAFSLTFSILAFPIVVLLSSTIAMHTAAMALGLFVIAIGIYKYRKNGTVRLDVSDWPVLALAAALFVIVLFIMLKTFVFTEYGLATATTHASDLNFHLSIINRYITVPQIPPEDPYLPGYAVVYNWLMHITFGELSILSGVGLFSVFHLLVPLVSALIFLDAYLLARTITGSDIKSGIIAAAVYVLSSGLSWIYIAYQVQQGITPDVFKNLVYEWPGIMTLKYDPTSLFFFLPQTQTFGLVATLFGFYLYVETVRAKRMTYAIAAGITLASLVLFHMITAFPAFVALGVFFLYIAMKDRNTRNLLIIALPLVIGGIAGLYQYSLLSDSAGSQIVIGQHKDVIITIAAAIGLLIPFALYGMYRTREDDASKLLIIYGVLNLLFILIFEMPMTSNTYRFLVYLAIPVSIFAGIALSGLLFSGKIWKAGLAVAVILMMVPSTGIMVMYYNDSSYTHATAADVKALEWIKQNTSKGAIIYEEPSHFPRVPLLTGRAVAYSGQIYTIQYHDVDKQAEMQNILYITDPGILYGELARNNINYVLAGAKEKQYPFAKALEDTGFFREVYSEDWTKVYEVVAVPVKNEAKTMDITLVNWVAFFAASIYLLFLPGVNIMRTLGWELNKKFTPVEYIVVAFGISVSVLTIVSLLLALPLSIGLNFYTLMILETLVIILTTKEVAGMLTKAKARTG